MKGWPVAIIGGVALLIGILSFPGLPACSSCGQDYNSLFLQNAVDSTLCMAVGIIILLAGFYMLGRDSRIKS